ncbi:MAG: hypothetical protein COA79_13370 [Planctomycetota bacterium]|nr:MAG: hypothetical protein COA79_13370 [Planctomycetota bacterium]
MPVFDYVGFDGGGFEKKGVLTSDSDYTAREKLRNMGIRVSEIKISKSDDSFSILERVKSFGNRINKMELINITRQLATLLKSGIPLADSMSVLIQQIDNVYLETTFRQILDQVVQGDSLADCLSQHKDVFSGLYIAMVRAGELSGKLDTVLDRLATYMYKKKIMEEKIKATLAYPVVLICIGCMVVSALLFFVLPRITQFFVQNNMPLPLITQIFMGISSFCLSIYGLILLIVLVFLFIVFMKYIKTPKGDLWFSKVKLRTPLIGELMKKSAVSKFTTTFATLLRTGIPALDALVVVKDVIGNRLLENVIVDVKNAVIEGSDMSSVLKKSDIFPPVVGYMMSVGEQSGQLEDMLEKISESYDQDIEITSSKIVSVIEPIMIVVMAVIVGLILVSVLLPIMEMSNLKT